MNMRHASELDMYGIESFKEVLQGKLSVADIRDLGQIPLGDRYTPDAYFAIKLSGEEKYLVVEVKSHVDNYHQIKNFLQFSESFQGIAFLVAVSISASIKRRLADQGVGFLELEKEFYFPLRLKEGLSSRQDSFNSISTAGFRAEAILKVIFYLSVYPEARGYTQRKLAETLDISVGSVNTSLKHLTEEGLIVRHSRQGLILKNPKKVFEFWKMAYMNGPRGRLSLGRFSPVDPIFFQDWPSYDLAKMNSYWGGEPGASKIDDYLTPGFYTIYTYETRLVALLKSLRLKKDPAGKIEILSAFWPESMNDPVKQTVPDFLILSDLLGSGIDRNIEAAHRLEKVKPTLRDWA